MNQYINEIELRKAIEQLKPNGQLFEIRILQGVGKGKKAISGFFTNADTLIEKLKTINLKNSTCYITLNEVQEDCYSWIQHDTFIQNAKTTDDMNITNYQWLFIDLDPVRLAEVSSTKEELTAAYELMNKVHKYMQDLGFNAPVQAISGNGFHLLYKIDLPKTDENINLVEDCLTVLSMIFDTEAVKIDTVNYNPARICKLYGTLAQKGADTENRPHRMSNILGDIKDVKVNDRAYLEKLRSQIAFDKPKPDKTNNYNSSEFDIKDFMSRYNLTYKEDTARDSIVYRLDHCPFNHNHENGDAKIFHYTNGAIAFKCHHNSCSGYKWQDVRAMFDPDAYNKSDADRRIEEGWKRHNREKQEEIHYEHIDIEQAKPNEPMFMTAKMINALQEPEEEYIKSGINIIDKRMKGLQKGHITVISGLRGAAKSTVLSQIILNCVEDKHTTVCYSGELSKKNFMKWMYMQASGKAHNIAYEKFEGYYCPDEVKPKIAEWLGEYFWLYNNDYGNDFNQIGNKLREEITRTKADLVIVDNLMALDLTKFSDDKYDAQTKFVWDLKDIAMTCNVHIIFVAHPRKSQGFLRLDDISGSGNIANIVDNAFIVHRNNADFQRLTKQMFGWHDDHIAYAGTNVIEICKDRETGIQDLFIPLWYEVESKRLKNNSIENITYSWNCIDGFKPVDEEEIPFP